MQSLQNYLDLPLNKKQALVQVLEEKERRRAAAKTVYGIVCPEKGLLRCWRDDGDGFKQVDSKPVVLVPLKLERFLTVKKKYKVVYGGRGGAKSVTISDILAAQAKDEGYSTMCFREVQKSLKESVYKALNGEIERLRFNGFTSVDSQGEIRHENGALFSFWGLNSNLTNMKSLYGYKRFWTEEAEATSQESLDTMGPTLRGIEGAELWFSFNPKSSEDPISKRFITPYQSQLLKDGFYEDEHHLIILANYQDNPWFNSDSALKDELTNDRQRVKDGAMSQVKFDHIWHGAFSDEVDSPLIAPEWFDACIDAHVKLGFEPRGMKFASHDPSDLGPDSKGYAARHGAVVYDIQEKTDGTVNEGCDWATGLAIQQGVDSFTWDSDGMGVSLQRQIAQSFDGKKVSVAAFRGSEGVDKPDSIYQPTESHSIYEQKTNKDSFRNKRAQYYQELRDRIYRTYCAVVKGEYHDPTTLISFSSGLSLLPKLRAELSRMPIKPNGSGLIELYTKEVMKNRFKLPSPNLGDSAMMLMRNVVRIDSTPYIPAPLKTYGGRNARSR